MFALSLCLLSSCFRPSVWASSLLVLSGSGLGLWGFLCASGGLLWAIIVYLCAWGVKSYICAVVPLKYFYSLFVSVCVFVPVSLVVFVSGCVIVFCSCGGVVFVVALSLWT